MPVEVRIPTIGESITEGVIVRWIKNEGDQVAVDEPLLELETDKASVEIPAETAGVLHILRQEGETVEVGDAVARIDEAAGGGKTPQKKKEAEPAKSAAKVTAESEDGKKGATAKSSADDEPPLSPAVRRLVTEHDLDPAAIEATGKGGRLTKADVLAHIGNEAEAAPPEETPEKTPVQEADEGKRGPRAVAAPEPRPARQKPADSGARGDRAATERVPMSRLRQRIAERLVQAQQTAAILTTFNEVDMSAVMALRKQHKEAFQARHGVALGFMSFFARACVAALQDNPIVNAQVDGTDIVYHRGVHLGVAVATERGLIVPVIHDADRLSFAGIEAEIARLAGRARDNKLSIDDLSGGTFSISNGGVFGSLLSTPILNPPQSAILGMHKIEKRPVVVGDEIVVRPMMYLALSYDHRLIDGEQAVTFLVGVKDRLEDPARLLLDV